MRAVVDGVDVGANGRAGNIGKAEIGVGATVNCHREVIGEGGIDVFVIFFRCKNGRQRNLGHAGLGDERKGEGGNVKFAGGGVADA